MTMLRLACFTAAAFVALAVRAAPEAPAAAAATAPANGLQADDLVKAGYTIGHNVGGNLARSGLQVDVDALTRGFRDGIAGKPSALTAEEVSAVMARLQAESQRLQQAQRTTMSATNAAEGKAFLASNRKRAGVTTTASGLQYEVLNAAKGDKSARPKASDSVTVHYKGLLLNGDEFDSSIKRGEPSSFPLGNVIAGWTEGLQLMKVGEKFRFFVPSELAYGERGAGERIGPNVVLTFEVELLGINQ